MDKEFLIELFAPFGEVAVRNMFGGKGVACRGLNFGLVVDGVLHLKGGPDNIPDYEAEGLGPWQYHRKDGKVVDMGYYPVPERLFDEPDEFAQWANKAWDAAVKADQAKPPKQRKLQSF